MAKPQRPGKSSTRKAPKAAAPKKAPKGVLGPTAAAVRPAPASAASAPAPERRSGYFQAVAVYERGLEALQRHQYEEAANLFESVLRQHPEEKELQERVRLYLNICRRQAVARQIAPQTIDERLFAATIAINGGSYDQALQHLRLVRDEDPDNDHALYMLAVAHAQRGEHAEAVAHLERAISINRDNRALARTDPDLQPLQDDESFRAALEPRATARPDRRRPLKTRTGR